MWYWTQRMGMSTSGTDSQTKDTENKGTKTYLIVQSKGLTNHS